MRRSQIDRSKMEDEEERSLGETPVESCPVPWFPPAVPWFPPAGLTDIKDLLARARKKKKKFLDGDMLREGG